MKVAYKYLFTLNVTLDSTPVGSFPEGRRIDVRYRGSVKTDPAKYKASWGKPYAPFVNPVPPVSPPDGSKLARAWGGLTGEVVAGADSVLVRNDSVATFAGRLTIRADDGYLINTQLTGEVDLFTLLGQTTPTLASFYNRDNRVPPLTATGDAEGVLGISFEGAAAEQEFAAAEFRQTTFFRYQHLLRGAFVASGKVSFQADGLLKGDLDVLSLEAK